MKVKIKKLDSLATIPSYSKEGDAGMDFVAISKEYSEDYIEYGTGLAIEIPEGHVGLLFPRSSISNTGLLLCNSVGVIDSGYRGEIKFRFKDVVKNDSPSFPNEYKVFDKVGQMIIIPYPKIELEEVEELKNSHRGENGFGSTGR
jgi:dUTP pyrophosphatase